jgi:hypothetical protein
VSLSRADAADRAPYRSALAARRAELHAAVDAYVRRLRTAGDAPERALGRLKALLGDTPTEELLPHERRRLLDDVAVAGIRAYHRIGAAASPDLLTDPEGIVPQCVALLERSGVHALLARLNARTRFRFTGVYRLAPPRLQHLAVYDRENPSLLVGGSSTLAESCCAIVAETGRGFETSAVHVDARLDGHLARRRPVQAYQGVALHEPDGRAWGTLCHYDLRPRLLLSEELEVLTWIAAHLPRRLLMPHPHEEGSGAA